MNEVSTEHRIDYALLMDEYRSGLVDRLRGFDAGQPYLSLWVPDDDPLISLRNMLDAAATAGRSQLWLYLNAATVSALELSALAKLAEAFGTSTIEPSAGGVELRVDALRLPSTPLVAPAGTVPARALLPKHNQPASVVTTPSKQSAVLALGVQPRYLRGLPPEPGPLTHARLPACPVGHTQAVAELGGARLGLVVDSVGTVVVAGFERVVPKGLGRLFEELCRRCEGLPVLEVRDHAVLRLEYALRPEQGSCAGIVIAEAADPAFASLQVLVREVTAKLIEDPGLPNTFDPGPSSAWLALDTQGRAAAIETTIAAFGHAHALPKDAIVFVEVQIDVRVLVVLGEGFSPSHARATVSAFEHAVREAVDPRLEVLLLEHRDRNKRRRLAIAT